MEEDIQNQTLPLEYQELETPELNEIWLDFLESYSLYFLMNEIPTETIEEFKKTRFLHFRKSLDDLGTGDDEVYWTMVVRFGYKEAVFEFDSLQTDQEWHFYGWKTPTTQEEDYSILELFSGESFDTILNEFVFEVLNQQYNLQI